MIPSRAGELVDLRLADDTGALLETRQKMDQRGRVEARPRGGESASSKNSCAVAPGRPRAV